MAFIKRHMMLLSCGLAAMLSLALLILGIFWSDKSAEAQEIHTLLQSVRRVGRDSPNDKFIDAIRRKNEALIGQKRQVDQYLARVNPRQPLVPNVFPEITVVPVSIYEFRKAYIAALNELLVRLKARPAPNDQEIREMELQIRAYEEDRRRKELAEDTRSRGSSVRSGVGEDSGSRLFPGGGAVFGPTGPTGGSGIGAYADANMTPEEKAKSIPAVRMSLVRAHEIYCYGSTASLDAVKEVMEWELGRRPDVEQLWMAQMGLWIQQDVLGALAKLNDDTASRLKEEDRWVANMPVKDILSFAVGTYTVGTEAGTETGAAGMGQGAGWIEPVTDRSASATGSSAATIPPPAEPAAAFTRQTSTNNPLADVMRFAVELVVAARDLPRVIDAICRSGFYAPISVSYRTPETDASFVGKIYGPDPIMHVRIEWEGYFLHEIYRGTPERPGLMPQKIKDQIQEGRMLRDATMPGPGPGMPPGGPPQLPPGMRPGAPIPS